MATILVVIFTALLWGATDRLAAATDALYRAADSQEKTAQTHERAYLVAGPLFGVPKCDIDEWAMKHRAQATMFKGPWRMTIQNFGRTAAYAIEIVWGFCPEDEFRKVDERIKDSKRKVSELLDRPDFEQWRKAYIENSIDGQFIISPTEHTPYQFRHVVVEDRDKYLDHVFFGRVKYLDVFRKCYYTTFSYLLKKESTDPIGNSFVYDQGECEQKR